MDKPQSTPRVKDSDFSASGALPASQPPEFFTTNVEIEDERTADELTTARAHPHCPDCRCVLEDCRCGALPASPRQPALDDADLDDIRWAVNQAFANSPITRERLMPKLRAALIPVTQQENTCVSDTAGCDSGSTDGRSSADTDGRASSAAPSITPDAGALPTTAWRALLRFGRHEASCSAWRSLDSDEETCNCGFADALRAALIPVPREPELREALRLAKEATNGWACHAKRQIEHDEIARLHREIADLEAAGRFSLPQQEKPFRNFASCQCPAKRGEDCWLTESECKSRTEPPLTPEDMATSPKDPE